MKSNFKFFAVAFASALTMGSITLVSCDKEISHNNIIPEIDNTFFWKSSADIPYYPSFDSLYSEIGIANAYSNPLGLWKHQNDRGILSIGATSDLLYDNLDLDDFSNLNEIMIYYETHTDWLDTCHLEGDKVALFPKWFFSEFRYVANQNGMFAVGNNVFKIFKNGLAYVDALNVETLASLTENQLASADTSIVHYCIPISTHSHANHSNCQYEWTQRNFPTDLTDRIYIILKTSKILNNLTTTVQVYNLHKGLFVWFPSRHNLSMNAEVEFHTSDNQNVWSTYTESKPASGLALSLRVNVYERNIDNISLHAQNILWFFHNYPDFHHYYSYKITASYPGHSSEILSYN